MARHSFCGYDCDIYHCDIGSFTSIANGVLIGGGEHPIKWISTSPVFYEGRDSINTKFSEFNRPEPKRTTIGSDVWIGARSIIKQGVNVGHGAIIGSGAVVTKDVKPYSIVAGVPAKTLRYRFTDEVISDLLDSEWWNLRDDILIKLGKHSKHPEVFLKNLSDIK
jgi:acetyltransferase-like isoleucine patch superfamily enzyme